MVRMGWVRALVLGICLGGLAGGAEAREAPTYPAVSYTWIDHGGIIVHVEGIRRDEAAGYTWNGDDITQAMREGAAGGLITTLDTPQGFDLVVEATPEQFGMVGDGLFGVITPTGSIVSVPMALSTLEGAASAQKKTATAKGCAWLTVSAPTGIAPNRNCLYASTNCYAKGKYHTGIDYSGSGDALAAANGVVVRVETLNRYDHGMGNNVIVKHTLSNCSVIYTTYSHLESIDSKIKKDATVVRGQRIGKIGGSGYGSGTYWSKHLHFEMKTRPVTGSPEGGSYWGYTPSHPDGYGYRNPAGYIGK